MSISANSEFNIGYHASPARFEQQILAEGIYPSERTGVRSHRGYEDSRNDVFVSTDLATAHWWVRRLGDRLEDYVIYEIALQGLELQTDRLSANPSGASDDGYMVVGAHVPPHLLRVVERISAHTYPPAPESLQLLREAGWCVPDPEIRGPTDVRMWSVGGYKGSDTINRVFGESTSEACYLAVEQLRRRGLLPPSA